MQRVCVCVCETVPQADVSTAGTTLAPVTPL